MVADVLLSIAVAEKVSVEHNIKSRSHAHSYKQKLDIAPGIEVKAAA